MRILASAALAVALAVAAACGTQSKAGFEPDGGGADGGVEAAHAGISLTPADLVLDVNDSQSTPVEYKAIYTHDDGTAEDVTNQATFSLTGLGDPIGSITANVFNAAPGQVGKTNIQAAYGTMTGTTSLTVRRAAVIVTPGTPADAPSKFGGTENPAKKPTLVYPPDGTMVPPNMNTIEVHYQGAGYNLFELHVFATLLDLKVYFQCQPVGGGCYYEPDATVWSLMANAGRGADPLSYTVRGGDGVTVGTSETRTISFGEEPLIGGLYYWNASGSTMRYEFGVNGQQAEVFMSPPQAGALTCVGCHVLSRDGKRIAFGLDIPAPAAYKVFDVATRTMVFGSSPGPGANFFSFSPDESQIMVSSGATVSLRDANTGAAIVDTLVANAAMPDWSPSGGAMVYAKPAQTVTFTQPGVDHASLETMVQSGGTWSAGPTLVPGGSMNNYYPSYSPDGSWVIFNRSPSNANSYDAPDAEVWVVPAAGGAPIPLANARAGGDSWPKWSTAVQKYRGKSLLWFTFSSRRAYGLRLAAGAKAQIWMAAFDPEAAAQGKDPSYAAFWLPFQDIGSGNHIAQWVTAVQRRPCGQGADAGDDCAANESCQQGRCVPIVK